MQIADLHIHSRYSRATSRDCCPEQLDFYARRKGITILGTGDFTHPAWRQELSEKLVPAEDGLYRLREDFVRQGNAPPEAVPPRFVVSGEISCIYKKDGKTRKVHNLILLPGLEEAEILAKRLEAVGNLHSDGRPILGLDSRDLLAITLEACPEAIFIPAHIWTPHFSVFGAFSGFETVAECFGDLAPHIHALETGLSSDPAMNWRVSALDGYQLVSNSDAHSPQKLGREANLLDIPFSYAALSDALAGRSGGLRGTIEFFPEEGKYHLDGHRSCGVCLTPEETNACGGRCPVCGKKLTIGVEHRVEELADRPAGFRPEGAKGYESLVPLNETIGWSTGTSPDGVRAAAQCEELIARLGSEFFILRECPLDAIRQVAGEVIAEGVRRLREGKAERIPGYDGAYGVIRLLSSAEIEALSGQTSLFGANVAPPRRAAKKKAVPAARARSAQGKMQEQQETPAPAAGLNPAQEAAASAMEGATAVIAGPGSGKTRTLVARIVRMIREKGVRPSEITAVTFTTKAAAEMRERLEAELGKRALRGLTVGTFHAVCLQSLPGKPSVLADEERAAELTAQLLREMGCKGDPRRLLQEISRFRGGCPPAAPEFPPDAAERYRALLGREGLTDFDGILEEGAAYFAQNPAGKSFSHLLVDEFQDVSPIQYELVRLWARGGRSLFVIGDPDQAIYGFRGADPRCFDRLKEDFPGLRTIRLAENYRSSPEIVAAALRLMEEAPDALRPNCPSGGPVRLIEAANPTAEGIFAAKEIARLAGGVDMLEARSDGEEPPRSFSEIAVLCRTRRQLELMEKCLRHDDIPCVVVGRGSFLSDPEVRGMLAFFSFLRAPAPDSLRQALSLFHCPADLSAALCARIADASPNTWAEAEAALSEYAALPVLAGWFETAAAFAGKMIGRPHKLVEALAERLGLAGRENPERLVRAAAFCPDMEGLLAAAASPEEDALRYLSGRTAGGTGAVTLMTLHAAKGLEFPVVFLYGVEKGSLPLESPSRTSDPAEERRLLFVGMTRARERLYLLASGEPSPLLAGMPEEGWQRIRTRPPRPVSEGTQLSLF